MSILSPEHHNRDGFPSGSIRKRRATIHRPAELRLPQNEPRLKFFLILRKGWENLDAELCPQQPKSISTKASDLVRNLPDWLKQVDELFMAANGSIDLTKEKEAYKEVFRTAQGIIDNLRPLVESDVRFHAESEPELHRLFRTVEGALIHLGGNYSRSAQPAAKSDARVEVEDAAKVATEGIQ